MNATCCRYWLGPLLCVVLVEPFLSTGLGADRYVVKDNPNAAVPYDTWTNAAADIQTAVDSASDGETVWVSNGIYKTGGVNGYPLGSLLTNRVALYKPVTLRSVNGPSVTSIEGFGPRTVRGVRCLYMTNGASIIGFTITNGATRMVYTYTDGSGAGIWCESNDASISNCVITRGDASYCGGGVYQGTLSDCVLVSNMASNQGGAAYCSVLNNCVLTNNHCWSGGVWGGSLTNCILTGNSRAAVRMASLDNCIIVQNNNGGTIDSTLNNCLVAGNIALDADGAVTGGTLRNCTVTGNSGFSRGGVIDASLFNCIVYYNSASNYAEYTNSSFEYSCTTPMPTNGTGNITNSPQFSDVFHLSSSSPCIGMGSSLYLSLTDIDGQSWSNPPSMGCDEYGVGSLTGHLYVTVSPVSTSALLQTAIRFRSTIDGSGTSNIWSFGDGLSATNCPTALHQWSSTGTYQVVFTIFNETYPLGVSTISTVHQFHATHYVDRSNLTPMFPFASWSTAATQIQDAVDVVANLPGVSVLVSNGVYDTGGRYVYDMTNRVAILTPITLKSMNGPDRTIIEGERSLGNNAVRCVFLTHGSVVDGFTITNGGTVVSEGDTGSGGGVLCVDSSPEIINCIIAGNSAYYMGGGVFQGTVRNSIIRGNSCEMYGGGSASATVPTTLRNCLLYDNSAGQYGGGSFYSDPYNCTYVGNTAGIGMGGIWMGQVENSIIYSNDAPSNPNHADVPMYHCCTTPLPDSGSDNITDEPCFIDMGTRNLRLQYQSPCIDIGINDSVHDDYDLDGRVRITSGIVDLGAYEYDSRVYDSDLDIMADAWELHYGLNPLNASDANTHLDSDGIRNRDEYITDTDPTDSTSFFLITSISSGPPVEVFFTSSTQRVYTLQWSTNLENSTWETVVDQSNVIGRGGIQSLPETIPDPNIRFYRVKVSVP